MKLWTKIFTALWNISRPIAKFVFTREIFLMKCWSFGNPRKWTLRLFLMVFVSVSLSWYLRYYHRIFILRIQSATHRLPRTQLNKLNEFLFFTINAFKLALSSAGPLFHFLRLLIVKGRAAFQNEKTINQTIIFQPTLSNSFFNTSRW